MTESEDVEVNVNDLENNQLQNTWDKIHKDNESGDASSMVDNPAVVIYHGKMCKQKVKGNSKT